MRYQAPPLAHAAPSCSHRRDVGSQEIAPLNPTAAECGEKSHGSYQRRRSKATTAGSVAHPGTPSALVRFFTYLPQVYTHTNVMEFSIRASGRPQRGDRRHED